MLVPMTEMMELEEKEFWSGELSGRGFTVVTGYVLWQPNEDAR